MSGLLANFLGSGAAQAALLHLFPYGETYDRAMATDMEIALQPVQRQLDRLEQCGVQAVQYEAIPQAGDLFGWPNRPVRGES